ncbi:RagB/SusD family nutrient uptake outer membrane protein [Pedobacter sp. MW01-1-1]|uniref:RagB/SusD family nutrient uptake outer membrane protein n=1 Tax=Pedobacter sp. MW01-1-1 TaxID=3383027 RepID=UPI003FF01DDC
MKSLLKIKYVFALFILSIVSVGCKDYLEEKPYSLLDNSVLKTKDGAEAYLIGTYEKLAGENSNGSFRNGMLIAANFGTEDFTGKTITSNTYGDFMNYTLTENNLILTEIWINLYSGINQANTLITTLPEANINEQLKARYIAEAKFLRGLYYFYLVRLFGGVPLSLTGTASINNQNRPRASAEEVYTQIIKDFEESIDKLPASVSGSELGRATKGAAQGFLSKVYLTLASLSKYNPLPGYSFVNTNEAFNKAITYGNLVLNNTQYGLTNNYLAIFEDHNDGNKETIFDVQMYGAAGFNTDGSFAVNYFAPNGGAGSRGGQNHGRPNNNLVNKFETNDSRREVNVAFFTYNGCNKVTSTTAYAGKFLAPCGFGGTVASTPNNFPLLRYADLMLMVAEAEAELNGGVATTNALNLVNTLRKNRFGTFTPAAIPSTNFLNFLFDERSRELTYEGQRWFDLVRTKRLVNAVKSSVFRGNVRNNGPTNISDRNYVFPIPQSEILNNDAIEPKDQNPGY